MKLFRRLRGTGNLATDRVEAFSDGVFSIAITLLVLGLTIPTVRDDELTHSVLLLWPKFLSYMISFAVIGIFWVGHHIMFHFIKRVDRNFIWLNNLLLMMVAFFPFPVALIGEYSRQEISIWVYGISLMIAGLIFGSMWLYASMNHRLISPNLPDRIIKLGRKVVFAAPVIYFFALLLYFVNPTITLIIYIVIPILYIFPSPIDELIEYEQTEDV